MEGQVEASEVWPTDGSKRCGTETCDRLATANIEGKPLCLDHFLATCTREIEVRSDRVKEDGFDSEATHNLRTFLESCGQQAKMFAENEQSADSPTKARMLEVLLRVSQANQRLRRGPRLVAALPVWLRREDPARTWEEQTWTSTVSSHGAGFVCHHAVEVGGEVVLCRRDKGNRARARVVYCRFDAEGRREIGVEILEGDDFWDLRKNIRPPGETSYAVVDQPLGLS